jgi:BolA family transcriptional regulator, general stress-responsive regulator
MDIAMAVSIAATIEDKLAKAFQPVRLVVQDQSDAHRGHAGAASRGETHFRIEVVSAAFEGLNRVARERRVQEVLAAELADRVHALSVSARTPAEDGAGASSGPGADVLGFRDARLKARKARKDR